MASSSKKFGFDTSDLDNNMINSGSEDEFAGFAESESDYEMSGGEEDSSFSSSSDDCVSANDGDDDQTQLNCSANTFVEVMDEASDNPSPPSFVYAEVPGPKHIPANATPIDFFNLFFSLQLFTIMVTETNRYARQVIQSMHLSPNSRIKQWQPTTVAEMRAFIAVILNMGLIKKPTIFSYWSTDANLLTLWFSQMFSRNRFQLLLRFFHYVDNSKLHPPGHPLYDPTAKLQVLVDIANNAFRRYYTPHQQLSVDESLVGTKAHSQLIQYLPNKHHHRWGVKFWMLCDSVVNYCLGFYAYCGAKSDDDKNEIKENGLGYVVVMQKVTMCFAITFLHLFLWQKSCIQLALI
ncbi:piggyBac transposable element-derived protein 4-like [Schistocerca piceifrons]|uniref:piggyBac transposable element-derived protein 4-like n=1 Tax=Schistocerca piceifrons TaxID=274613 RepID=UPI001F5FDB3D|nr:piggyBac transposable element-derived protein 4-like [Schistocerca piceifrons]